MPKKKKVEEVTVSINFWEVPCFPCEYLEKCGVGQDNNPIECIHFNKWVYNKGKMPEEPES